MTINAPQIRAARSYLDWTAVKLSMEADVALATIYRMENDNHNPVPSIASAVQHALERAGVEFIKNGIRVKQNPVRQGQS